MLRSVALSLLWGCCAAASFLVCPRLGIAQESFEEVDPALVSPLAREPRDPEGMFSAVLLMLRLDRTALAAKYLDQLLQSSPDDETLLAIRAQHGTAAFLQIAGLRSLQPQSQELLKRLTQAAATQISDPVYLDSLLNRLSGTTRQQSEAVTELQQVGAPAVPLLLRRMSDPATAIDRELLVYALIRIGQPAVPPLLGAVRDSRDDVRTDALRALGVLGDRERVLPHVWYPAYNENSSASVRTAAREAIARILYRDAAQVARIPSTRVADRIRDAARACFRGEVAWDVAADGRVSVWTWEAATATVVEERLAPKTASLVTAQRLAHDALQLDPKNDQGQALYLMTAFANDARRAGDDRPLPVGPGTAHDLALVAGPHLSVRVLDLALTENNVPAAVAALSVLEHSGSPALVQGDAARRPPLVRALDAPDARVQFAAAVAILQLNPHAPFRGSSRVVEILARAVQNTATPQCVVIDPNIDRASTMANQLRQLQFESHVAATGQEGFELATARPVDLVALHVNTIRWDLSQSVGNFRADSRTAQTPLVIYGPRELEKRVATLLESAQPATYMPEASDPQELTATLRALIERLPTVPMSDQSRTTHATVAARWLRTIAERSQARLFDLTPAEPALEFAISNPQIAEDVVVAFGGVKTTTAQESLVEAVLAPGYASPVRSEAALQLAAHIKQFGVLISPSRSAELYTAWSVESDPKIKTALAAVIGSLHPTASAVNRALQQFESPPAN